MLKVMCDRCGAEILPPGKIGYLNVNFREEIGGPVLQENPLKGKHFCEGCIQSILETVNTKKEKTNVKPSRKRKIDYEKIMALHHAGWENSKIADEMGMTRSGVCMAIWYYKNRIQGESEEGGDSSGQEDSGPIS